MGQGAVRPRELRDLRGCFCDDTGVNVIVWSSNVQPCKLQEKAALGSQSQIG